MELDERTRQLLQDCLDIIQHTYKGKPIGIPVEKIIPGIYVVDWGAEKVNDNRSVCVERVTEVSSEGDVTLHRKCVTNTETMASIVLAGPFED